MGDSLMYSLLPLDAPQLGIALPLVGVLLSANRLVRLVSNTWAAAIFRRYEAHLPFFLATLLGALAAVTYSVGWGFAVFLLARIGWGIAWSGLRQGGYEAVWHGKSHHRGRLMGMLWGLVRLGSAISVALGGFLRDRWGYRTAAGFIATLTVLALPVAWAIRWTDHHPEEDFPAPEPSDARWTVLLRQSLSRWIMAAGFWEGLVEGVLISTASLFLAQQVGNTEALGIGVGTVAGLLLAVRFTADLIFGPVIGLLSDRWGHIRSILLLTMIMLVGLAGASFTTGVSVVGYLMLVFVAGAGLFVTLNAASSNVAAQSENPHLFVGIFTTANDAGAAVGPLLAYSLAQWTGLPALYLVSCSLLLGAVWQLWRSAADYP